MGLNKTQNSFRKSTFKLKPEKGAWMVNNVGNKNIRKAIF